MEEKKKIRKILDSSLDIEGSVDDAIEKLKDLKETFENQYEIIGINKDHDGDTAYWEVFGERLETDEEAQERIENELRRTQNVEEREYNQYLKLRDKFRPRELKENLDDLLEKKE